MQNTQKDKKHLTYLYRNPSEMIDYIFRKILPEYGYAVREEQIKLSQAMYAGLTGKQISINEAEVGTGKSLAYLIAGFAAKLHNQLVYRLSAPVTISTSSIELQKALIEKEIPRLSFILRDSGLIDYTLSSVLRKGREHYFCLFRYRDYIKMLKRDPAKNSDILMLIDSTRFSDNSFDLDALDIPGWLKGKICVCGKCRGCSCKESCRYRMFCDKAAADTDIDFQVTNHNMYTMSMYMKKENNVNILTQGSFTIIDEAHKFREAAQEVFGNSVSEYDIPKYLDSVKYLCADKYEYNKYRCLISEAQSLNRRLFEYLKKLAESDDSNTGYDNIITLERTAVTFISNLLLNLRYIEDMRNSDVCLDTDGKRLCYSLSTFISGADVSTWIEADENNTVFLRNCSKNVGEMLYSYVWNSNVSHVLTSGTMSDGSSFGFFKSENGLDRIQPHLIQETQTPSPFDYKNHTRLYIPDDMPFPDNNSDEYINAVSERIMEIIEATNGHTAILFTSYKVLHSVFDLIGDKLSKYEVFCMSRSDRNAIRDFKRSRNGVLFASGSMWEGVDCIGDCLSSVIIVRLPFPIRSAAMEEKKGSCVDIASFIDTYVVPEMLIKLRQGVGRLIRSEADTGVISILDSRAGSGIYRSRIDGVLTKYPCVNSIDKIYAFINTMKKPEYFKS